MKRNQKTFREILELVWCHITGKEVSRLRLGRDNMKLHVSDGIQYLIDLKDMTATVYGFNKKSQKLTEVHIAGSLKVEDRTYRVTQIGMIAFRNCRWIQKVIIPDTVTHIQMAAFNGCSSLDSVIMSKSIIRIGANAFGGCEKLHSIDIASTVKEIADNAFTGYKIITADMDNMEF